jgi:hypothetical protein
LAKEDQEAIISAAKKIATTKFGSMHEKEYHHIIEAQKKAGATVNFWKQTDLDKWNNNPAMTEVRQIWLSEAKAAGMADPEGVMKKVGQLINEAKKRENK